MSEPLLGLAVVLGVGFVVTCVFAYTSGWRRLARELPGRDADRRAVHDNQAGKVGWVRLSRALRIGVADAGLHLSFSPIFAPHLAWMCPPLLIPWSKLQRLEDEEKSSGYLWQEMAHLVVGVNPPIHLRIPAAILASSPIAQAGTSIKSPRAP